MNALPGHTDGLDQPARGGIPGCAATAAAFGVVTLAALVAFTIVVFVAGFAAAIVTDVARGGWELWEDIRR